MRLTLHSCVRIAFVCVTLVLSGCGGAEVIGPERIASSGLTSYASSAPAPAVALSAEVLLDWAESNFGQIFPSHQATSSAAPFVYRHYSETDNYLGVRADNTVWILGPIAGSTSTPVFVGNLPEFDCWVFGQECSRPTLRITGVPASNTVAAGDPVAFSVAIEGAIAPKYQWQRSVDRLSWLDIPGATAERYAISAVTSADSGVQFRAIVVSGADVRTSSAAALTVLPVPTDTAPPSVVGLRVVDVTHGGATLTWQSSESATSHVSYGTAVSNWAQISEATPSTVHSMRLSGLLPATNYYFRVRSVDAAGNSSTGADMTFTTSALPRELSVVGNTIVDERGQRIILRGVNRSGTEYACAQGRGIFDPSSSSPATLVAMLRSPTWRYVNALRVPLNESCWLGINGAPASFSGENYRATIHDLVTQATDAGLIVVLELHWTSAGSQLATGQQPMLNRDHSVDLWREVALRFRGNGRVAFDLHNEPHPDNNRDSAEAWRCWRDGGTCAGVPFMAAGMQEVVTAIRAAGARNLILLAGVQYANALTHWLTYRPFDPLGRIAASWHVYGGTACASMICWDAGAPSLVRAVVPLIATEFGTHHDAAQCRSLVLVSNFMRWAERSNVGTAAWTLNAWGNCHSLIANETGEPTEWGRAVLRHSWNQRATDESALSPELFVEEPLDPEQPLAFPVSWYMHRQRVGESWQFAVAFDKGVNVCDGAIEESFAAGTDTRCLIVNLSPNRYAGQSAILGVIGQSSRGERLCSGGRELRFRLSTAAARPC